MDRDASLAEVVARDPSAVEIVLHPRGSAVARAGPGARWHVDEGPLPAPAPSFAPLAVARAALPAATGRAARRARPARARRRRRARLARHPVEGAGDAAMRSPSASSARSITRRSCCSASPDAREAALDRPRRARARRRAVRGRRRGGGDPPGSRRSRSAPIARRHYRTYLGYAGWFHGGPRFPALQAVWPDAEGRFPWERWSSPRVAGGAAGPMGARTGLTAGSAPAKQRRTPTASGAPRSKTPPPRACRRKRRGRGGEAGDGPALRGSGYGSFAGGSDSKKRIAADGGSAASG